MSISTGTPETRVEHSEGLSFLGMMTVFGLPALLALIGLMTHGFSAIRWGRALLWGAAATALLLLVTVIADRVGTTRLDLPDLLGSVALPRGTLKARVVGAALFLADGALLGVEFAFTLTLFDWAITWGTGLVWGLFMWVLALVMLTSSGPIHPKIRRGEVEDPGPAGLNMGRLTPIVLLVAHLVYGLVLGLGHQVWPLS